MKNFVVVTKLFGTEIKAYGFIEKEYPLDVKILATQYFGNDFVIFEQSKFFSTSFKDNKLLNFPYNVKLFTFEYNGYTVKAADIKCAIDTLKLLLNIHSINHFKVKQI